MAYAAHRLVADAGPMSDNPQPELPKRPKRRRFEPAYKLAILAEWERATEPGAKAALLRREGLYSSVISDWRRQQRAGSLVEPARRPDGRGGPSYAEVERLRRDNARLREELTKAEFVIEVQGKVSALLGELSKSADSEESETP